LSHTPSVPTRNFGSNGSILAPPFRDYDGRGTMRSLADALQKLQELGALSAGENVEIRTTAVQLPDRASGLVIVLGPPRPHVRCVIRMPSAATFSARTPRGERLTLGIDRLHGATSDPDGNVALADGRLVHGVDLIPAPFTYQLNWQEELITRLAVKFLGRTADCYRSVDEYWLPRERRLRFDEVAKLEIPRLKPLIWDITQHRVVRHLRRRGRMRVSPSIITKALARAGMRLPRSQRGSSSATIVPRSNRECCS